RGLRPADRYWDRSRLVEGGVRQHRGQRPSLRAPLFVRERDAGAADRLLDRAGARDFQGVPGRVDVERGARLRVDRQRGNALGVEGERPAAGPAAAECNLETVHLLVASSIFSGDQPLPSFACAAVESSENASASLRGSQLSRFVTKTQSSTTFTARASSTVISSSCRRGTRGAACCRSSSRRAGSAR